MPSDSLTPGGTLPDQPTPNPLPGVDGPSSAPPTTAPLVSNIQKIRAEGLATGELSDVVDLPPIPAAKSPGRPGAPAGLFDDEDALPSDPRPATAGMVFELGAQSADDKPIIKPVGGTVPLAPIESPEEDDIAAILASAETPVPQTDITKLGSDKLGGDKRGGDEPAYSMAPLTATQLLLDEARMARVELPEGMGPLGGIGQGSSNPGPVNDPRVADLPARFKSLAQLVADLKTAAADLPGAAEAIDAAVLPSIREAVAAASHMVMTIESREDTLASLQARIAATKRDDLTSKLGLPVPGGVLDHAISLGFDYRTPSEPLSPVMPKQDEPDETGQLGSRPA